MHRFLKSVFQASTRYSDNHGTLEVLTNSRVGASDYGCVTLIARSEMALLVLELDANASLRLAATLLEMVDRHPDGQTSLNPIKRPDDISVGDGVISLNWTNRGDPYVAGIHFDFKGPGDDGSWAHAGPLFIDLYDAAQVARYLKDVVASKLDFSEATVAPSAAGSPRV